MANSTGGPSGSTSAQCNTENNSEQTIKSTLALESVVFTTVYDADDVLTPAKIPVNSHKQFKPLMAHQVFGEGERIFGYRDLIIDLRYLHNSCRCYATYTTGSVTRDENVPPDDIMEKLNPWLPANYVTDLNTFSNMLKEENHKTMYGEVIAEFRDKKEMGRFPTKRMYADYKVTHCNLTEEFKEFHQRFETFIIWFIDAANFIDLDDERWLIFYVYEEFFHPEKKTVYRSPIGFCSVYRFYNYPNRIRPRISQFFILPTHQKRGIGTKFYEVIMETLVEMQDVVDITVEEPTPLFQSMRTISDALNMYSVLKKEGISISNRTLKRVRLYLRQSKLCKRQCQKLIDILNCVDSHRRTKNYSHIVAEIKERYIREAEGRLLPRLQRKPNQMFSTIVRTKLKRAKDKRLGKRWIRPASKDINTQPKVKKNDIVKQAKVTTAILRRVVTRSISKSILTNSNSQNISAQKKVINSPSVPTLASTKNRRNRRTVKKPKRITYLTRRRGELIVKPQGGKRMAIDKSLVNKEFLDNKRALAEEEYRQYVGEMTEIISHILKKLDKNS